MSLLALAGIVNVFIRFVVLRGVPIDLRARIQDIGVGALGIGFIIALVVIPLVRKFFPARPVDRKD